MTRSGQNLPYVASLRGWARAGFPNRHKLRAAIRSGELQGFRPGRRTIYVRLPDLLEWLQKQRVVPSATAEGSREIPAPKQGDSANALSPGPDRTAGNRKTRERAAKREQADL